MFEALLALNIVWQTEVSIFALLPGFVEVWRAPLRVSQQQQAEFNALLCEPERSRAERFKFPVHRDRFIVAHGILRVLLGRYMKQLPEGIEFVSGHRGKPFLGPKSQFGPEPLYFNISHSGDWGLFAFARQPVGVDLEASRQTDVLTLAQRFFSRDEAEALTKLSDSEQLSVFYQFWTGKEAFLKATGDGISALEQIELQRNKNTTLVPKSWAGTPELSQWSFWSFVPQTNYWGALAVSAPDYQLQCFDYRSSKLLF
ncbi:MAG: 4'-phosphopantetheinyl transferase superfamily protein [Cyanobacteria bacterium P01_H01_bin.15]